MIAHPSHRQRGAAMAEVAVVISFTLLVLFGMMQIILIGYLQIAGDSAVFVAAHEYTLGVTPATIASAEASMVPKIIATALTYNAATPNPVSADVFSNVYGPINQNNRNGGYSMVRPQNFQVSLGTTAAYNGVLGFNTIPISSGAIEGYYLMTNSVMNNSGAGPNDATQESSAVLNPQNASPFEPNADTLATNMNVPPYYAPTVTMQFCADPWYNEGGANEGFHLACAHPVAYDLGQAEFLDNNNYTQTNMGVGLNGTFQAMASHQRIYADLITAFPPNMTDAKLTAVQKQFQNYSGTVVTTNPATNTACSTATCGANWRDTSGTIFANGGAPLYCYDPMYYWGLAASATNRPSWMRTASTHLWNNEITNGLSWPVNYDAGNDGVSCSGYWNGASVGLVYEWDQPNGTARPTGPGQYPYHPLAGTGTSGDPGY